MRLLPQKQPLSIYNLTGGNKIHQAFLVLLPVIIVYEIVFLLSVPSWVIQFSIAFVLLFAIVFSALKFGMVPALITAAIANAYILFALGGPGRNIVPLQNMLDGEWLIFLIFFFPAILIGYLSDRIKLLILNERQAKEMAEQERLQLATMIEQMPVGVAIATAPDGKVVLSNQYLERLLNHPIASYNNFSQYPSNVLINPTTGEPLDSTKWPLTRIIKDQETLVNEEFVYLQNDGSKLILRVNGVPVYNSNGQLASGIVIIDDITAIKEAERRKDDFLSMVSHELKTPVTSIKMFSQLLYKQSQNGQPDHLLESLSRVNEQANRLQRLINDILYLAKVQSGRLEYHFNQIEINQLISETIKDIQAIDPKQKILFHPTSKITLNADFDRLSQVITNIINNAIKYSPHSKKIEVSLHKDKDRIVIAVQDFGIGISKSEQKRIFERYYQVTHSDGTTYPGLGIGLYFSAKVIEKHQGKIWVESQKGKGSTFYISLPISEK